MNDETRHKVIWGWLRLFLGWLQMSLVAASIGALLTVGLHPISYVLVAVATAVSITSRLLYHGRRVPALKGRHEHDKSR